jgi:hypothetical protein
VNNALPIAAVCIIHIGAILTSLYKYNSLSAFDHECVYNYYESSASVYLWIIMNWLTVAWGIALSLTTIYLKTNKTDLVILAVINLIALHLWFYSPSPQISAPFWATESRFISHSILLIIITLIQIHRWFAAPRSLTSR